MRVASAVIYSGHFADGQLAMIDETAADWNRTNPLPHVRSTAVNRAEVPSFPPDHAGLFETSLMVGLASELVDLTRLSTQLDTSDRFDPRSPLWGIVGADPRSEPPISPPALVDWLVGRLAREVG
jgi:creatinine amidohydrolase